MRSIVLFSIFYFYRQLHGTYNVVLKTDQICFAATSHLDEISVDGPDSPDSQNNLNGANTPQTNGHLSNGSDRELSMNHSSGKIIKSGASKHKKGKNSKRNRYDLVVTE